VKNRLIGPPGRLRAVQHPAVGLRAISASRPDGKRTGVQALPRSAPPVKSTESWPRLPRDELSGLVRFTTFRMTVSTPK